MVIQGPRGVRSIHPLPAGQFTEMLAIMDEELNPDGVKIGVLFDAPHVGAVADFLNRRKGLPVVIDPIVTAKNGIDLVTSAGMDAMVKSLFPLAEVITPNTEEASRLCAMPIRNLEEMRTAAASLVKLGPKAVVIKGGHLEGDPIDLLFDGKEYTVRGKKRIERQAHGTGCTFSTLLACFIVLGYPLHDAFLAAEQEMDAVFRTCYRIAEKGYHYMSPAVARYEEANRWEAIKALDEAIARLVAVNPVEMIPHTRMNIACAINGAKGIEDVAAFPGRIGVFDGKIHVKDSPCFGASVRTARSILDSMAVYPFLRACATLRHDDRIIRKAAGLGMQTAMAEDAFAYRFTTKTDTGLSGTTKEASNQKTGEIPDIVYDAEDRQGRERTILLFARHPVELIHKMEMIRP